MGTNMSFRNSRNTLYFQSQTSTYLTGTAVIDDINFLEVAPCLLDIHLVSDYSLILGN